MLKVQNFFTKQGKEVVAKIIHFPLPGLLPAGEILALNLETRTLSLLSAGPVLVMERQFSINEIRLLLAILESFPHYSPYEALLSHISSNIVTASSIAHYRQHLQEAKNRGTWQQELRPIRRALSSLRNKLHCFNLEISNIRERGCSLTSLTTTSPARSRDD